MSYVELSHVSFAFVNGTNLFDDCSLRLESGVTALVGGNGAGKSTLLRLIAGELRPDEGHVRLAPAGASLRFAQQDVEQQPPDVAAFVASFDPAAHRLRALLRLQDAEAAAARWSTLSAGERQRLKLGAVLFAQPDVLLLDEPTNHVDNEGRALLIDALRTYRGTALLVSHDRELIDALAQRTVRLHDGKLYTYDGGYSVAKQTWDHERAAREGERALLVREAKKAERKLTAARQKQAETEHGRSTKTRMRNKNDHDAQTLGARNLADWAEARASRQVTVRRREAERTAGELAARKAEKTHGSRIHADFSPSPRPHIATLHTDRLGSGEHTVLQDVRIVLRREDRVRIQGQNGAGKSTLLRALYNAAADRDRVLYLPQELTQEETQQLLRTTRSLPRDVKGRILEVLAALGIDPDVLLATASPSLGEARKLLLAHGLGRGAFALLLDEPQNHLDLPAIERMEDALRSYPGALAVVTHDPRFAHEALRDVWTLRDGRVYMQG